MNFLNDLLSIKDPFYLIIIFFILLLVVLIVFKDPLISMLKNLKNNVNSRVNDIKEIKDLLLDNEKVGELSRKVEDFNDKLDSMQSILNNFQNLCEIKKCDNSQEHKNINEHLLRIEEELKAAKDEIKQVKSSIANMDISDHIFQANVDRILQRIEIFHDTLIKINTRLELISGKSINF